MPTIPPRRLGAIALLTFATLLTLSSSARASTIQLAPATAVGTVRAPNLGPRVTGAGRVRRGHAARYRLRYYAEVSRRLEWAVVRDTRCGHSWSEGRPLAAPVQWGEFDAAGSGTAATFDRPGRHRACGCLRREYDDGQARLVAWRSVRVVRPRPRWRRADAWE